MSFFNRIFRRKKVEPKEMINDFEIGKNVLIQQTRKAAEEMKKEGYDILEVTPLLISVGRAEKTTPLGIILVVDQNIFQRFHKYLDKGKYGKNLLQLFHKGEYSFLLIIAKDEEKKIAIIYPTAFRRKHLNEIKSKDRIYIYILNAQTQKYTLVYVPKIKWRKSEDKIEYNEKNKEDKPPSTLYR